MGEFRLFDVLVVCRSANQVNTGEKLLRWKNLVEIFALYPSKTSLGVWGFPLWYSFEDFAIRQHLFVIWLSSATFGVLKQTESGFEAWMAFLSANCFHLILCDLLLGLGERNHVPGPTRCWSRNNFTWQNHGDPSQEAAVSWIWSDSLCLLSFLCVHVDKWSISQPEKAK